MRRVGTSLRFALVGVTVAAVYMLLFLALRKIGLSRVPANALAFGGAVALQYVGQARFTFRRRFADRAQIVRFAVMISSGFVTSALITGLIAPALGVSDGVSAAAVTVLLPVQNFVFMTLWVFPGQRLAGNDA